MEQLLAALDGAWRVLLVGMVLGAGLPALFALGLRALSWGTGHDAGVEGGAAVMKPHPLGRPLAWLMFALVILSVLAGIGYITAHGLGWSVTFNGLLPVFTKK